MATSDNYSPFKDGQKQLQKQHLTDDNQYKNLNLNQNYCSSNLDTICSKNVATHKTKVLNYGFTDNNSNLQEIKDSKNKFIKNSSVNAITFSKNDSTKSEKLKEEKNNSSNGSTLSLHISAYENFVESLNDKNDGKMKKNEAEFGEIKESKNAKQVLVDSKIVIQNPFEFPRQRENDDGNEKPEIAQFKASQRLLTSNASVTPNYIFPKIPKGESLKNESEVKIFTNCFKLQKQLKEASHRTIEKDKNVKAVKQELKDVAAEIRQQTYKTENSLKGGGCFDTNCDIYKYDIEFTKTIITESLEDKEMPLLEITDERMSDVFKFQTQKLYRFLMNEFIESFPAFFSGDLFCFDGFATLYSFIPLSTVSKKLKLSTQKCANIMKENCQILLNIKPSADYLIYFKDDNEQGRQFLKAAILNSALQNPENLPYYDNQKIYCFDNKLINPGGLPLIGKIQRFHVGVVPNIIFTEDFTAVAFDTIKDIFYKPTNLFKLCCGYFQLGKIDTFPMQEYNRLNEFLDGMICLPIFGENKNVSIILSGHNSSRADAVHMIHENSEISLTMYYIVVYGYNIKHRYWPLAVAEINGKRSYYPLECLTVAPGQKAKISNLAPEKQKLFEECTNIKNFQRFEEIENVPSIFKLSKDPFCQKLQLSMEESPIHVKARIFSPPKLEYKNQQVSPDSLGKWKISSIATKYFVPSSCEKWKAVLLTSPKRIEFNQFTKFLDYYHKTATFHGLELKLESFGELLIFPATIIRANDDNIYEMFQEAKKNSVEFILFGLDETDEDIYSFIKCCERSFEIITQCIPFSHIFETIKHQTPVIGQIIAKTNIKLGGLCYNLPLAQFQFDKNSLFIGIHINMPSKISDDDDETSKYATIGISANDIDKSFFQQSGNFFVQSLEHDKIETVIEAVIDEILKRLKNGLFPSRIIIYRSGSDSEDEIQNLLMKEVSVIRTAVSYFCIDIPITFITSTTSNSLQFFNAIEDLKSRSDEILSGTVIDSNVIHPTIDEFYLQASVNSDSNFQPTKFSIVYTDEMYASLALFERWTFGLCWNSQNNCSALNIPSVLSSAEKYAQRGRQLLKQFFDRGKNFDFTRTLEDRSKKLNYSKIEKLRNKNIVD